MSEHRTPLSMALDLFVFAPLGAAIRARDLVPELAELGRRHVEMNLNNYRAVGELAVGQLRRQARERTDVSAATTGAAAGPSRRPAPAAVPPDAGPAQADATEAMAVAAAASVPVAAPRSAGELPIQDYDELSAVQVLPRLSDLRAAELRAVADYEVSHRGRETILGRINQLLGPHP